MIFLEPGEILKSNSKLNDIVLKRKWTVLEKLCIIEIKILY